jgi:hydroxyacid-oxoacid transhydrogenase
MDTAKAANLWAFRTCRLSPILTNSLHRFTVYKDAQLLDFINAPVGKGLTISEKLRPLIAGKSFLRLHWRCLLSYSIISVPTTAGTGSETTGTAIVDIPSMNFKTGIANRALRPALGIVDTNNTETCPTAVHISAGLDVVSLFVC